MKSLTFAFGNSVELAQQLSVQPVEDDTRLLIQCFCETTDEAQLTSLQKFFKHHFPKAVMIGATSDGAIAEEYIYVKSKHTAIFTIFEHTDIHAALIRHSGNYHSNYESGKEMAKTLFSNRSKALITFADGIHTNGDEYLRGINAVDESIVVAGGLAGDGGALKKTYVFTKDGLCEKGAVGVVLESDRLRMVTDFGFDWMPIGKKLKITKSVRNRVYGIDGSPSVDVYAKYLGKEVAERLPQIGIEFPLVSIKDGMPVGRAVLHKHYDGSLSFAGNLEEGDEVRFGIADIDMILRGTDYRLQKLIAKTTQKIEVVFIYSCMARRRFLGEFAQKEISAYARCAPTAGFFTYGEFYSDQMGAKLYNESMTVLALSESEEPVCKGIESTKEKKTAGAETLHAIAHLSNVVSEELESLNVHLEKRVKKATQTIYKQAYFDKMTKLPNRLKMMTVLAEYTGSTLLLVNIDDFTMINDFYGHYVGDLVIKQLAQMLEKIAVETDATLYRLPADEFALIVPPYVDREALNAFVQKILRSSANLKVDYEGNMVEITATVAAAMLNEDHLGYPNAGMALKHARRAHKNFVFFEDRLHLNEQYESNLKIAGAIRNAIKNGTLVPYFQPIVELSSGKVVKYEALARIVDQNGLLMPQAFLPVAKKLKLYPKITQIMIEKSFQNLYNTNIALTINLTMDDISNDETMQMIYEKLNDSNAAQRVTFEIVETDQLENEGKVRRFINRVRESGAHVAIDDFGSGFANFEYLTKIEPDFIKIDGALVKHIDTDKNALIMVETIVSFAQKLGLKTIAEFVHSKGVLDIVNGLKIDYVQGYYFGKPQAAPARVE